jgi:RNA polymerase sigma factor (sigma-70 family)
LLKNPSKRNIANILMGKPEITDKEILSLFANEASRNDAFQLLVKKYQVRLYWHIRKIVLSHDDTDDLLQESFVKVWQNLPNFRGDSALYTWLFRIATNETLTFIQKKKKKFTLSFDDDSNSLNSDHLFEHDAMFEGSEIEKKLHHSLSLLPEKQRLVFNMKYFDELKYEEISEILNVSVGALKASYHHAVKKIETYFKNESL